MLYSLWPWGILFNQLDSVTKEEIVKTTPSLLCLPKRLCAARTPATAQEAGESSLGCTLCVKQDIVGSAWPVVLYAMLCLTTPLVREFRASPLSIMESLSFNIEVCSPHCSLSWSKSWLLIWSTAMRGHIVAPAPNTLATYHPVEVVTQHCASQAMTSDPVLSAWLTEDDAHLLGLWSCALGTRQHIFSRFLRPGSKVSTAALANLLRFGCKQEGLNLVDWPTARVPSFHRTSCFLSAFLTSPWSCSELRCPQNSHSLPSSISSCEVKDRDS